MNLLKKSVEEHSTDSRRLAVSLVLSHETVRSQLKTILRVLDVHCRYAAVAKAQRQGIIPVVAGSPVDKADGHS